MREVSSGNRGPIRILEAATTKDTAVRLSSCSLGALGEGENLELWWLE